MKKLDKLFVVVLLIGSAVWLWNIEHKPINKYSSCISNANKELVLENKTIDHNGKSKSEKQYYYNNTSVAYRNNLKVCESYK